MDIHLEYIVDQTAKYSDWLAQGFGGSSDVSPLGAKCYSVVGDKLQCLFFFFGTDGVLLSPPKESDIDDQGIAEVKMCSVRGLVCNFIAYIMLHCVYIMS